MGIELRSQQFHQKWLSSSALILAVLVAGCQPKEPIAESAGETSQPISKQAIADRDGSALPSMSSYTSEHPTGPVQGKQSKPAGGSPESAREGVSAADDTLSAGQYCFYKAGNQNWLSIRLQITDDRQITGESAGTVNHPQKGEAHYRQTFTGGMTGDQALVEVTTHIAEVTQSRQEAWSVTPQQLDMERVVIKKASCMKVSPTL